MKTITLFLVSLLTCTIAHAQWIAGLQAGINKRYSEGLSGNVPVPIKSDLTIRPAFIATAFLLSDKALPVNFGLGLSMKRSTADIYMLQRSSTGTENELNIRHRTAILSVYPVVDVNIDKKRYFHILLNPNFNFLIAGGETGFARYYTGKLDTYEHTKENVRRVTLGISAQLQVRYPITKSLMATGNVGWSINTAVSKYIPQERGNIFFQLGVIYKLPRFTAKEETDKKTKGSEQP